MLKHTLIRIDLPNPTNPDWDPKTSDYAELYIGIKSDAHSIMVLPEKYGNVNTPALIKTQTHEVDNIELLTDEQRNENILKWNIHIVTSFDELVQYINDNGDSEIMTINLGIASHPEADYAGHDLKDWILRIRTATGETFEKLKWRFTNTWDVYGHDMHKWLPWFKNAIEPIQQNFIQIEVANIHTAKQIGQALPEANVKFELVYFKRITRQNLEKHPNETFQMNMDERKRTFLCLNHFSKWHRKQIVDHIQNNLDKEKFYYSYIHEGIQLTGYEEEDGITLRGNIQKWQDTPPREMLMNTYFYICTETFYNEYNHWHFNAENPPPNKMYPFITEKSLKSAYYYLPILFAAMPGHINAWKEAGFESFPEVFDESYDGMINPAPRMKAIKDEITRVSNLSLKECHDLYHQPIVIEKLKHNREVFNRYIRNSSMNQWGNIPALYKRDSNGRLPDNGNVVGKNPYLDEIFLDK